MMSMYRRTTLSVARSCTVAAAIALGSLTGGGLALADGMPYYEQPAPAPAAAAPAAAEVCAPGLMPVPNPAAGGAPCEAPAPVVCAEGTIPGGAPGECVPAPAPAAPVVPAAAPVVAEGLPETIQPQQAGGLGEVVTPGAEIVTGKDIPVSKPVQIIAAPAAPELSSLQQFLNSPELQMRWGAAAGGLLIVIGGLSWFVIRRGDDLSFAASAAAAELRDRIARARG